MSFKQSSIRGKWLWITGASSGIGEAGAERFSREGAKLVLSARRKDELERVAAKCLALGAQEVFVQPLDQANIESLQGVAETVLHHTGGAIEVMIHNAGVSQRSRIVDTTVAVDERIMRLNFLGPVALTKALLPTMIARKSGHFVVVSSLVGVFGTPLRSTYSASKHALHGFFETLRAEHHNDHIGVTMFCPGFVQTNVSRNALTGDGTPLGTMDKKTFAGITAEQCAERLFQATVRREEEVFVGGRERLAVYVKRLVPSVFSALIHRVKVT